MFLVVTVFGAGTRYSLIPVNGNKNCRRKHRDIAELFQGAQLEDPVTTD